MKVRAEEGPLLEGKKDGRRRREGQEGGAKCPRLHLSLHAAETGSFRLLVAGLPVSVQASVRVSTGAEWRSCRVSGARASTARESGSAEVSEGMISGAEMDLSGDSSSTGGSCSLILGLDG